MREREVFALASESESALMKRGLVFPESDSDWDADSDVKKRAPNERTVHTRVLRVIVWSARVCTERSATRVRVHACLHDVKLSFESDLTESDEPDSRVMFAKD